MVKKTEYALEIEQYIGDVPEPYQEWLRDLRVIIHEAEPDIQERLGRGIPVFSYQNTDICYLAANAEQITMGFYYGHTLHDPFNVLKGSGDYLRFLHIQKEDDIRSKRIHGWIQSLTERIG
jgi:hypothetical protein